MSTITRPRPAVNGKSRKPVVAELTLTINSTPYVVIPIDPGPDNTAAFRLVKEGHADSVYDVCRTVHGTVECDCPSYEATYRGNGLATCKHGQALIQVGLLDSPSTVKAPAPIADEPATRVVGLMPPSEPAPPVEAPEPKPAPFDREPYRAQDAVAEGRALYLAHRHLHTSEPLPEPAARDIVLIDDDGSILETPAEMDARHRAEHAAKVASLMTDNPFLALNPFSPDGCCPDEEPMPCQACLTHDGPADLSDGEWLDSWRWELGPDTDPDTDPETDQEVLQLIEDGGELEAEGEGPLGSATPECFAAVAEGRADWAREPGYVPFPGFVTRENAEDLMTDDALSNGWAQWRDRERADAYRARALELAAEPEPRSLAEQVDDRVRELRSEGSPLGDLLADHVAELAREIRALDATSVEQYIDRRDGVLASL